MQSSTIGRSARLLGVSSHKRAPLGRRCRVVPPHDEGGGRRLINGRGPTELGPKAGVQAHPA